MLLKGVVLVLATCHMTFVTSQINVAVNAENVLTDLMGGGPVVDPGTY